MYSRHDIVWLTPDGWSEALAQVPAPLRAPVERWRRANWPAVVRRNDANLADGFVCAGIPLPPDRETGIKPRVALRLRLSSIDRRTGAFALARAVDAAPAGWRAALGLLSDLQLRVYGSLAMQAFTGLDYLTPSSDIDVLFAPTDQVALDAGIALLSHVAERLPLDGEVVFPGGAAVAWKEWRDARGSGRKVLAKRIDEVRLVSPDELAAALEA
ncbi:malonate decarboxylase holo-[acyl-carrier-protein] synthase [Massilia solisilvae]|uniref:Malonate decarboxylase holo-[acyl-carrier-protein] synthase n=1 Tax=Massilia solisilvae TaxID=1811225 RepID=A0ABT2BMT7_9BURK|nr:malonate decarboxylase holo-[acyl-carrier-protein] synthase [Massilia solisilvae]MCS0609785.1 malonate decarboxylase holo-[acyl-carrier-protein] synthase [Massilia solisilvae]